jgi:hypothetical protein
VSEAERKFREDRALRNAAHALVKAQVAQVRQDLAAKGIGQRMADKAGDGVKAAADHSLEVASSNRGIVAATVAALVLWLLRNPLIAGGRHLWETCGPGGGDEPEAQPEPVAEPEPSWRRLRFPWDKAEERSSD